MQLMTVAYLTEMLLNLEIGCIIIALYKVYSNAFDRLITTRFSSVTRFCTVFFLFRRAINDNLTIIKIIISQKIITLNYSIARC